MKKRSMKRALSAVLTLCMALPGASVAFGSASAATVSDDSSTSASVSYTHLTLPTKA